MKRKLLTPSDINDHLFMAFPLGWMAGLLAGTVYAGFHWGNLQFELGRTLLAAVTVAQCVTAFLITRQVKRIGRVYR